MCIRDSPGRALLHVMFWFYFILLWSQIYGIQKGPAGQGSKNSYRDDSNVYGFGLSGGIICDILWYTDHISVWRWRGAAGRSDLCRICKAGIFPAPCEMCIRDRSGDIVDSNYAKKLKNYANAENKELREIGITIKGDGTLELDEKKLKAADISQVKKLFTGEDGFAKKAVSYTHLDVYKRQVWTVM